MVPDGSEHAQAGLADSSCGEEQVMRIAQRFASPRVSSERSIGSPASAPHDGREWLASRSQLVGQIEEFRKNRLLKRSWLPRSFGEAFKRSRAGIPLLLGAVALVGSAGLGLTYPEVFLSSTALKSSLEASSGPVRISSGPSVDGYAQNAVAAAERSAGGTVGAVAPLASQAGLPLPSTSSGAAAPDFNGRGPIDERRRATAMLTSIPSIDNSAMTWPEDGRRIASPPAKTDGTVSDSAEMAGGLKLDRETLDAIIGRGRLLLSSGDIASARLLFERAYEAGDSRGAKHMAMTYDPAYHTEFPIAGLTADRDLAEMWYDRADAMPEVQTVDIAESAASQ